MSGGPVSLPHTVWLTLLSLKEALMSRSSSLDPDLGPSSPVLTYFWASFGILLGFDQGIQMRGTKSAGDRIRKLQV